MGDLVDYSDDVGLAEEPSDQASMPIADVPTTNLVFFHCPIYESQTFAIGGFRKVDVLAKAIHGKVWLYSREGHEELVVVKQMKNCKVEKARAFESNDWTAFCSRMGMCEDALTEIGVLQYLNHQPDMSPHLITLIEICRDTTNTMIVTEHCDEGDLFAILKWKEFSECEVKVSMRQLFQAVSYLHSHNIAHRDISLENLLVKGGDLKLMDFGQAVQIHQQQDKGKLFRYFRRCGKPLYRAPECHVPHVSGMSWQAPCPLAYTPGVVVMGQYCDSITQIVFHPGFVPGAPSTCAPCGFHASPVDLFACGVVLFVLFSRQPPWQNALFSDSGFHLAVFGGIASLWQSLNIELLSDHGMGMLTSLMSPCPPVRFSAQQCLDHPWFDDL